MAGLKPSESQPLAHLPHSLSCVAAGFRAEHQLGLHAFPEQLVVGVLHDEVRHPPEGFGRHATPVHGDAASCGASQPAQDVGERRLTGPVGADEGNHLPAARLQAHAPDHLAVPFV